MRVWCSLGLVAAALLGVVVFAESPALREQNEVLFRQLQQVH